MSKKNRTPEERTADGVQVLTVIAIVAVGVAVFLLAMWLMNGAADAKRIG